MRRGILKTALRCNAIVTGLASEKRKACDDKAGEHAPKGRRRVLVCWSGDNSAMHTAIGCCWAMCQKDGRE